MAYINIKVELEKRRGDRTWLEVAKEIGCTAAFLSLVVNEKRGPGARILKYLGIEEQKKYVRMERAK